MEFNKVLYLTRLEIAVKICGAYPGLFRKVLLSREDLVNGEQQTTAYHALRGILENNPSIKEVLKIYT